MRKMFKPRAGDTDMSDGVCYFDFTHCKIDDKALALLMNVAEETGLEEKLRA